MSRIRESDIAVVRERARIDDVVRDYVNLKSAGGGSLKGLCPFHDERSPSFTVTPARGFFHCFGCQESGDVFTFIRKIEGNTTFRCTTKKLEPCLIVKPD
jgi:DNA primase